MKLTFSSSALPLRYLSAASSPREPICDGSIHRNEPNRPHISSNSKTVKQRRHTKTRSQHHHSGATPCNHASDLSRETFSTPSGQAPRSRQQLPAAGDRYLDTHTKTRKRKKHQILEKNTRERRQACSIGFARRSGGLPHALRFDLHHCTASASR